MYAYEEEYDDEEFDSLSEISFGYSEELNDSDDGGELPRELSEEVLNLAKLQAHEQALAAATGNNTMNNNNKHHRSGSVCSTASSRSTRSFRGGRSNYKLHLCKISPSHLT